MLVGHSLLLLSSSACRSSLGTGRLMILIVSLSCQDCDMELQYRRITNFCLHMEWCYCHPHLEYVIFCGCGSHCHLISCIPACKGLTVVRSSPQEFLRLRSRTHARTTQNRFKRHSIPWQMPVLSITLT